MTFVSQLLSEARTALFLGSSLGRITDHEASMKQVAGTIFESSAFWSGVSGWMAASILKIVVNWHRTRRVDFHYLTSLGGMPSAHSAMVSALATSVGCVKGFGSTIFVVTFGIRPGDHVRCLHGASRRGTSGNPAEPDRGRRNQGAPPAHRRS